MKTVIEKDTKVTFKGKPYTLETFSNKFADGSLEEGRIILQTLIRKGSAHIVDERTHEQKHLDKVVKEEELRLKAEEIDADEEAAEQFKADKKREGRLTYELIEVDYPTVSMAQKYEEYYTNLLKLQEDQVEIKVKKGQVALAFYNITDAELSVINRTHLRDKVVDTAINTVGKTTESAVNVVDYTMKNVASPILQISAKAATGIVKSLVHAAAKTGSTIVISTGKGIRDTAYEIKHDNDVIKAKNELVTAKDTVMRKVAGASSVSSGIRIIR